METKDGSKPATLDECLKEIQKLRKELETEKAKTVALKKENEELKTSQLASLEQQREAGESTITELQKQLRQVNEEKKTLETKLNEELKEHENIKELTKQTAELRVQLSEQMKHSEEEWNLMKKRNEELKEELKKIQGEKFVLDQKIQREHQRVSQLNAERIKLETNLEFEAERQFNIETSPHNQMPLSPNNRPRKFSNTLNLENLPDPTKVFDNCVLTSPRPSSNNPKELKKGWGRMKDEAGWHKRFFVLYSNEQLFAVPDELDVLSSPLQPEIINMEKVTSVAESKPDDPTDPKHHLMKICLSSPKKEITLHFDGKESFDEWKDILQGIVSGC